MSNAKFKKTALISGSILGAAALLVLAEPETVHAFESAKFAIKEICGYMTGSLGGLLMTAAGVGAVVSAAFGNFKASYGLLIVGIGAFGISSIMSFYFPEAAGECTGANGAQQRNNGAANRTAEAPFDIEADQENPNVDFF